MSEPSTRFVQLNANWNADPNVPAPRAAAIGKDVLLTFELSPYMPGPGRKESYGTLIFLDCACYRFTHINDHGWFLGQCRFSQIAPAWGEFYEVIGDFKEDDVSEAWIPANGTPAPARNFLFYLRDETFECVAGDWRFDLGRPAGI